MICYGDAVIDAALAGDGFRLAKINDRWWLCGI